MDIENNDFVKIEVNGIYKLAKVLDISINNISPVCRIQLVDDNSETLVGAGVLEKVNIFNLMKTNCPACGNTWTVFTEGVNDIKHCKKCNKSGESICIDFRKSSVLSKKQ